MNNSLRGNLVFAFILLISMQLGSNFKLKIKDDTVLAGAGAGADAASKEGGATSVAISNANAQNQKIFALNPSGEEQEVEPQEEQEPEIELKPEEEEQPEETGEEEEGEPEENPEATEELQEPKQEQEPKEEHQEPKQEPKEEHQEPKQEPKEEHQEPKQKQEPKEEYQDYDKGEDDHENEKQKQEPEGPKHKKKKSHKKKHPQKKAHKNGSEIEGPFEKGQEQTPPSTCIEISWFDTEKQARDIGVGAQGDLYAAGVDGRLYLYNFLSNTWTKMEGDFDLEHIRRVDTSYDGTPYVVTSCGDTYYLSCDNKWVRLHGCAKDIGVGRGGEVYKIGCDDREHGYGIYKLYCQSTECKCCGTCHRFKFPNSDTHFEYSKEDKKCHWIRMDGSGVRIDVGPSGYPYVVTANGSLLRYDGTDWQNVHTGLKAKDVTVSNEAEVFVVDRDKNIFRVFEKVVWPICGNAKAITAGPYSQPFIVGQNHLVYTSSKQGYN